MILRPYQDEAKDSTVIGFESVNKQLVVIPTGGGKTILFAHLAAHYAPRRTLILAHRKELIDQAKAKIETAVGLRCEIEKAEQRASMDAQVVIASIQTMAGRADRWPPDHFHLVVVDEAHHALADSYRAVLSRFENHAKILGVTATPDRGDKKNLGQYFERIAYEVSLLRLIKDNYLAPIKIRTLPVRVDLSGVKRVAGDFSADDLAAKIEPWLERVATAMAIECWDRKTVVFLPLVKTAERMADILGRVGLQARCVSGYDDDRESTLRWFAEAGPGSVLCNSMLLTEGWDQPDVDCIVNLRPTAVRALFAQMVGRGTRIHPGKQDLLLLDFLWQTERLALVSAASLITGNVDDVKQAQTALAGGDEVDLVQVCASVEEQRMRKVVAALKENRKRAPGTYEALELCVAISAVELADFEPLNEREARPATARQIAALEKAGFSATGIKCFGHASAILDRLAVRRMEGLATPKQVRMLARFQHPSPETASFEEASAWLNREFGARRNAA